MTEPRSILADRYEIVRSLGSGGMGTVFEAVDRRFGNQVAVKRLDIAGPAVERAFEREARLLRDLKHDGLPRVIDHFEHERSAYLVMDYVGGDDLSQALESRGRLSPGEVVDIARAVLGVLEYLHGRTPPVLHRDIKPQNIKVHDGQVYLLDFGLAKGYTSAREGVAGASSIAGYSPHYAPLEQIRGVGTDTWSDVYALAATMYCLLTGSRPADALERATAAATGESDPLVPAASVNPKVPDPLSQLLVRAMSPNPIQRPRDAREMRNELERSLARADGATIVEASRATAAPSDGTIVEPQANTEHDRTLVAKSAAEPAAKRGNRVARLAVWTGCLLLVAAIGVSLWMGVRPWAPGPAHASPLLVVGTGVEREISPGERHEYHVVARTGDSIRVAMHRLEGGRYAVAIAEPSNDVAIEVRSAQESRLPAFWVARRDGVHVVSVRLSRWSGVGRYRLTLERLAGAVAADLKLINEQATKLAALALETDRQREFTVTWTSGPGLPSERFDRALARQKQTEAEIKAASAAAAKVCLTSAEPTFEAWALEVDSPTRGLHFTDHTKWIESPVRHRILAIYRSIGDIEGEAGYLEPEEAARLCAKAGYLTAEADHLMYAAVRTKGWRSGDDSEARLTLTRAYEIARSRQDAGTLSEVMMWASLLRAKPPPLEYIERYSAVIELWRKTDNAQALARNLVSRARIFADEKQTAQAMADFEEAAGIYKDAHMPANRMLSLRRLASLARKSGDESRAQALLREANAIDPVLGALNDDRLEVEAEMEINPDDPDPLYF